MLMVTIIFFALVSIFYTIPKERKARKQATTVMLPRKK